LSYPSQHLWMTKLLGFDYDIEYKKGRENVVADGLSRSSSCGVFTMVMSTVSTTIMNEVRKSWELDNVVQGIIKDLQDNPNSHPHYKWVN